MYLVYMQYLLMIGLLLADGFSHEAIRICSPDNYLRFMVQIVPGSM